MVERWLPLIVILLAGVLLASDLNQGWFPPMRAPWARRPSACWRGRCHIGITTTSIPAAWRISTPHFSRLGRTRHPRSAFHFPVCATVGRGALCNRAPLRAADRRRISRVTAFVWSVPNYPASVPSWFNLFFATFGALALLHGLETGRRHWLVLAGVAGGISFLFKLSGIFYLLVAASL